MAEPGKTEKATPRRREVARKKGTVVRSTELNSTIALLALVVLFRFGAESIYQALHRAVAGRFAGLAAPLMTLEDVDVFALGVIIDIARVVAPIALTTLVVALAANLIQVGFLFTTSPITPKISNMNPVNGFKRLFSRRSLVDLLKSIMKIAVIGMVTYLTLRGRIEELVPLMGLSVWEIMKYIAGISYLVMLRVAMVLVVLAILDYFYQRWEYEDSLKMSKSEVRDEYKQMEGDPLIKSRIRRLQLEYARKRMMLEIPEADVVVTNPVHYAVALRYRRDVDPAPMVVAKGARLLAERIKEKARDANVPIVENQELARALYKGAEVGGTIPEELFSSVAEVLAYVYRLSREHREGPAPQGFAAQEGEATT